MDQKRRGVIQIKRAFRDLLIISIVAALSVTCASTLHAFSRFARWHQEYGVVQIDKLILLVMVGTLAFAIFSFRRWRELQKGLAAARTLHGFLPVCASCKKIRDDRGSWNQLEAYIENHFDAEITHGICPDCAKKLYGFSLKEDEDESNKIH